MEQELLKMPGGGTVRRAHGRCRDTAECGGLVPRRERELARPPEVPRDPAGPGIRPKETESLS